MAVSIFGGGKPEYPNKTPTLSYNVVSSTSRHEQGFELTTLVVIGTDCIGTVRSETYRDKSL